MLEIKNKIKKKTLEILTTRINQGKDRLSKLEDKGEDPASLRAM